MSLDEILKIEFTDKNTVKSLTFIKFSVTVAICVTKNDLPTRILIFFLYCNCRKAHLKMLLYKLTLYLKLMEMLKLSETTTPLVL